MLSEERYREILDQVKKEAPAREFRRKLKLRFLFGCLFVMFSNLVLLVVLLLHGEKNLPDPYIVTIFSFSIGLLVGSKVIKINR